MTPRLDMIGIVVRDMPQALAFYRRLGLPFPEGSEAEQHVETTLAGGLRLALDSVEVVKSFDPTWTEPVGSPRMGLAFLVGSPDEVDATYAELVAAGYQGHKEPWDAFWGQRYAQLHDPDGNVVDLFAPLDAR